MRLVVVSVTMDISGTDVSKRAPAVLICRVDRTESVYGAANDQSTFVV